MTKDVMQLLDRQACTKVDAKTGIVEFYSRRGSFVGHIEGQQDDNAFDLNTMEIVPQKRGARYGTMMLQHVLMAADAALVPTNLRARSLRADDDPDCAAPLDRTQLTRWFRRHGFMPMIRSLPHLLQRAVPRAALLEGLPFQEARDLANRHGANCRPFRVSADGIIISWGVTAPDVKSVPVPHTLEWWWYEKTFMHDLLMRKDAQDNRSYL